MRIERDKPTFWRKYTPALPISFHFLFSGVVWIFVGQMLVTYGIVWFQAKITQYLWPFILSSVLSVLSVYRFGFSKIVYKNIDRLQQKQNKICIFAFMEWRSYIIMVFMMGMGITLRTIIGPNEYLAILYIGIGGGMFLSGIIYFKPLFQMLKEKNTTNKNKKRRSLRTSKDLYANVEIILADGEIAYKKT